MWIIGVIGDIAAGKSTVASHLETLGSTWIDADKIAKEALDEPEIRDRVAEHFGPQCVKEDGAVNRKLIASFVFGDDAPSRRNLQLLESWIHPWVRKVIRQELLNLADQETVVVLDIPLLIESKWVLVCDEVWFVTASDDLRQDRARQRGWDDDELFRRERKQLSATVKRRHSQRVFSNEGTVEELKSEIDRIFGFQQSKPQKFPSDPHCLGGDWLPIV